MVPDKILVQQLHELLTKGHAHVTFEQAVAGLPLSKVGVKPQTLPYSIWMLVAHIRITQADILDFSRNPDYQNLQWPEDYWPKNEAPADSNEWNRCLEQIEEDRNAFMGLLSQPGVDLFLPFPHGEGQNLFREAVLIADHTSYHTGQIILVRRMLGEWQ